MKRAILVSSGTLAGLAAVLTYSGADVPALASGTGAGGGAGLGAAAGLGAPPADPTTAATPDVSTPAASVPAAPTAPAAAPTAPAAPAAAPTKAAAPAVPAAAPTKAAAPAPAPAATKPAPVPTPVVKPTPSPTPTNTGPKDYVGSLQTHKYGQVQVGIRVQGGKITKAWAVVYPNGPSQPYSDFSIPVLVSETVAKQSTNIANVSGATLTWQSWKVSLQAAMSQAGL